MWKLSFVRHPEDDQHSRKRAVFLLQATRGARNPNLNVAIKHARHVCGLMLARFLWTSSKNEFGPQ